MNRCARPTGRFPASPASSATFSCSRWSLQSAFWSIPSPSRQMPSTTCRTAWAVWSRCSDTSWPPSQRTRIIRSATAVRNTLSASSFPSSSLWSASSCSRPPSPRSSIRRPSRSPCRRFCCCWSPSASRSGWASSTGIWAGGSTTRRWLRPRRIPWMTSSQPPPP